MRYTFVGKKVPFLGKPLWELVGNLKNFGVGRLFKKHDPAPDPGLSFCRIIKVLPLPPHANPFNGRRVIIWYEEIEKGYKRGIKKSFKITDIPQFQLIPRIEEAEYLKKAEELDVEVKHIKKYCYWPPLYKKLWEQESLKYNRKPIPKLKLKTEEYESYKVIEEEGEAKPHTCSLYKSELSVDEMYKEIVKLKKLIKSNTATQEQ